MKKVILILLLTGAITSCSKEDHNQKQLSGEWFLSNVDCFCRFDPDIDFNDFKLIFTEEKLEVKLKSPSEEIYFIAKPGTYNYYIDGDIITINNMSFNYKIEGDKLIMTFLDEPQIADDELTLLYKRS